ncbi:hypothetical protein [Pontibacter sp. SGAir0037]|uniref:hypothetical protein n=1 Tax=Pontibacter sp. SGAir0037 TaxID=2571030 RepID=UPI0010CCBC25|nr:hypothetical protein [Pontibacter sp. SGAir0037]QCR23343.1 hypothetical protein C1N53_14010 [Pontibacter sp. SGAir0037]
MDKIKFYKNWDTDIKYPYLFLLLIGILSLLLGVVCYFAGDNLAYAWDKLSELQVVPVPVHEFNRLLMPFALSADGYLILERYDVSAPAVHTGAAILFLGALALCIAFYTAAASTMRQYGYFGAILLLMLFLSSFSLDALGVFAGGYSQTLLIVCIAVLASLSYAFQAFLTNVRFLWRVLAMLAAVLFLGALIFSEANYPAPLTALHLVNYSSMGTLVATVLFFIWVSYANVQALLWVNTQGKTPERRFGLGQFFLIGMLYLVNLLLLFLNHLGYIQYSFIVNGYVIFLLSAIAGFWGMQQREAYYGKLFPFKPTGAVLYLVFAIISFLSIGYAFATANDTLVVLYQDLVIYTHLAFGFMFFVYVIMNFRVLLSQRLAVYKVVYQPNVLPLYTVYTMGTIILAIFVFRTQYRSYFYAHAGYYNYLGDLYHAADNDVLAERFYQESDVYDNQNVKANYNLANIYRLRQERNNEIVQMKEALSKRPNPKMYVRLANLYDEKQYFFEKLYVLREGIEVFPKSAELYNNMALLYMQTSVTDSIDYYFDLAQQHSNNPEFIRSNRLAYYTRQAMLDEATNLLTESHGGNYLPLRTNMSALRQLIGRSPESRNDFTPDSIKSVEEFTLFYNASIRRLGREDTTRLNSLNSFIASPGNQLFSEDLHYLKGLVHHYDGRPKEGRSIVENLALAAGERSAYYYHVLGLWMMEERNYIAAAAYFKLAKDRGYSEAFLPHGYALALAHQPVAAVDALEEVGYLDVESVKEVAQTFIQVLEQDVLSIVAQAPDTDKVQYLLTYLPQLSLYDVNSIVNAVQEKELKRHALVAKVEYLMNKHRWKEANEAIKEAAPVLRPEDELRSQLNLFQLELWLQTNNHDVLLSRMNNLYLTERDKRQKIYYRARIAEVKGREREATEYYNQALAMLLYDEKVVEAAAAFFQKQAPQEMTAYNILLDGITYNPYAVNLHKAYALESLNQGLTSYADQALSTLEDLLPASEYTTFKQKFEEQRQEIQAKTEDWQ